MSGKTCEWSPTDVTPQPSLCRGVLPPARGVKSVRLDGHDAELVQCLARPASARDNGFILGTVIGDRKQSNFRRLFELAHAAHRSGG